MGTAPHHVKSKVEAPCGSLGDRFFVMAIRFLRGMDPPVAAGTGARGVNCVRSIVPAGLIVALKSPQKQGRQTGVFLQCAGHAIACSGFSSAERLLEGRASYDLPDLLQVIRQSYFRTFRCVDCAAAAENFQGRSDACDDEIGAADALVLQVVHPAALHL